MIVAVRKNDTKFGLQALSINMMPARTGDGTRRHFYFRRPSAIRFQPRNEPLRHESCPTQSVAFIDAPDAIGTLVSVIAQDIRRQ